MTELRGPRVLLRRFRPGDVDDVFAYASDPEVTLAAGWEPHRTPFDTMAYIQDRLAQSWGPETFAVEYIASGRVIGVVDLRVVSRLWGLGEVGYTLSQSFWGRGLNVEAVGLLLDFGFEQLGLRRIRGVCEAENRRSFRTMEKLGMQRERNSLRERDGRGAARDRICYSILRREWFARREIAAGASDGVTLPLPLREARRCAR